MKAQKQMISIRISVECMSAYKFLQDKKINPAKYLRQGGEQLVITMAERYKLNSRIKKIKLPF